MKKCMGFVLITISIFISSGLYAKGIYVSPTGSSTAYTEASPGSAKGGLALAQAGDTVWFMNGTYKDTAATWQVAFNTARSGTSGNPIILKAVNRGGAILQRNSSSVPSIGIQNRNYIVIDGFKVAGAIQIHTVNYCTVQNCEVTLGFIQGGDVSLNWGINAQYANYCTIQNNYVHDMDNSGNNGHNSACIMLFGNSTYNVIQYNTVDGGGNNIYLAFGTKGGGMNDNIWRYNFGRNCAGAGFMAMGSTDNATPTYRGKVYQNVIINTPYLFESYRGGHDWEVYNNTAYNLTCMFNLQWETGTGMPTGMTFYNNLGNKVQRVYYRDASTPAWPSTFFTYTNYNQIYNVTAGWSGGGGTAATTLAEWQAKVTSISGDTNSSTSNPGFVNAGGTNPADYKRTSYPSNGRGGSVMGAYITGNEAIGYATDTIPPAKPTGVSATIIP
jgi:hypothetical protein